MEFENTVVIDRPPEDVFAYLADFSNVPKWNYAIVETQKTSDGPVGVGATYDQTRSIPTRSQESFVVSEFQPNERLAIHGDLGPFTGTLSYELESRPGGTILHNSAALQGRGMMKVAAGLVGGRIQEAVAANLQKLKQLLEAGDQ
ncbi:MAG: SRPBCC family protein [Actinomycetota bacterium]